MLKISWSDLSKLQIFAKFLYYYESTTCLRVI